MGLLFAEGAAKLSKKSDPTTLAREILPVLEGLESFDEATVRSALEAHAETNGAKVFAYFPMLRYAVSGQSGGPDLMPMVAVLGKETVLRRLRDFIA